MYRMVPCLPSWVSTLSPVLRLRSAISGRQDSAGNKHDKGLETRHRERRSDGQGADTTNSARTQLWARRDSLTQDRAAAADDQPMTSVSANKESRDLSSLLLHETCHNMMLELILNAERNKKVWFLQIGIALNNFLGVYLILFQ